MPGWNAKIPEGVARCACRQRREWWAMLSPDAGQGCCGRSCCTAKVSVVMATREEIEALRKRAFTEQWMCPRCGAPLQRHQRNYQCLDARTKALRAKKQVSYHSQP